MADNFPGTQFGGTSVTIATKQLPDLSHAGKIVLVDAAGNAVGSGGSLSVSGPLTDAQLRAAVVPVSLDATSLAALETVQVGSSALPAGAATEVTLVNIDTDIGGVADAQALSGNGSVIALLKALRTILNSTASEATLAAFNAKFNAATTIPDNRAQGIAVRPVGQDTWAASFSAVGASILDAQFSAPKVGAGVGYSQAGGALLITTGVSTNAEFLTRSLTAWRGTLQMRYSFAASQRIANQNFAVILADLVGENLVVTVNSAVSISVTKAAHGYTAQNIGQFLFVGGISGVAGVPGRYAIASIPNADTINFTVAGWPGSGSGLVTLFGHSHVKHLYNGVTATSLLADAQRNGWASGDSALTINTTAAPGHIMQAHLAGREVFWGDTLRATSLTPNMTSRGSRLESLPDDNLDLYLFLWNYNGTVAPASTTTWTVNFVSVEKFANFPMYVQGQEMQGTAAPAPVAVVGSATVAGTVSVAGAGITGGVISPLTVVGVAAEASSAKTVSGSSAAAITNASARGAAFIINVSAVSGTTPTLTVKLQIQDAVSLAWVDVPGAVTASITGISTAMLTVYPGIVEAANSKVSFPLPRTYRFAWTIGGTTPSFTFSISAQYVL